MGIPASYKPAKWRGTLPADSSGSVGISFAMENGDVARLRLSKACVAHVRETLGSTRLGAEQQGGNRMATPSTYAELQFQHRLLLANAALIELTERAQPEVRDVLQQAASLVKAAQGKTS